MDSGAVRGGGAVKTLTEATARMLRPRGTRQAILQVVGFGCLSVAAGMWLLPVGIAVAGASLLIMSGLLE